MRVEVLLEYFNIGEILESYSAPADIIIDPAPSFFYEIGSRTVSLLTQAVKHAPATARDAVTAKVLNQIKPTILKWTDKRICAGDKPILKDIGFSISGRRKQELRISVEIDDVQFDQIIIAALPLIQKSLIKKENMKTVNGILDILDNDAEAVISGIFAGISEEKQKKIAELLMNDYHGVIIDTTNHYMEERNLSARVKDIEVDF